MIVWIFQTGEPLPSDNAGQRKMRLSNLTDALIKNGHKVVIWTSSFSHQDKHHRSNTYKEYKLNDKLEIRLIPSPGYKKNISLQRLVDHFLLGSRVRKLLTSQTSQPDVAFVGFPPIEFAYEAAEWLNQNEIPYMLDVKDQWPDVFVFKAPNILKPVIKFLFKKYYSKSKSIMRNADVVSTISNSFMAWVLEYSGRVEKSLDVIATLSPVRNYDKQICNKKKLLINGMDLSIAQSKFSILFVGSLSKSFNFDPVFEAIQNAYKLDLPWKFIICGSGEFRKQFIDMEKTVDNLVVPGSISEKDFEKLAGLSNVALAPYEKSPDFQMSIPNKVLDYMSFSLPICTSLDGELGSMLLGKGIGRVYSAEKKFSLFDQLLKLFENKDLQEDLALRAGEEFRSNYEGTKVYQKLVNTLEKLNQNID